jgi:hypothetical protein
MVKGNQIERENVMRRIQAAALERPAPGSTRIRVAVQRGGERLAMFVR